MEYWRLNFYILFIFHIQLAKLQLLCEPGSSEGIAIVYWIEGRASKPGGREIFRKCPDRSLEPPSLL
jgi:hypothetical protein